MNLLFKALLDHSRRLPALDMFGVYLSWFWKMFWSLELSYRGETQRLLNNLPETQERKKS